MILIDFKCTQDNICKVSLLCHIFPWLIYYFQAGSSPGHVQPPNCIKMLIKIVSIPTALKTRQDHKEAESKSQKISKIKMRSWPTEKSQAVILKEAMVANWKLWINIFCIRYFKVTLKLLVMTSNSTEEREDEFVHHKPLHPLPKELQSMTRDETVCQFCGVSYLIHNEIAKLQEQIEKYRKELEHYRGYDERENKLKRDLSILQDKHESAVKRLGLTLNSFQSF